MESQPVRYEPWPAWAKATLIALLIFALISVLPWVVMWSMGMNGTGMNMSGMIGACVAMMERISH